MRKRGRGRASVNDYSITFTHICSTLSLIHSRVYLVAEIHLTLTLTLTSLSLSLGICLVPTIPLQEGSRQYCDYQTSLGLTFLQFSSPQGLTELAEGRRPSSSSASSSFLYPTTLIKGAKSEVHWGNLKSFRL